MDVRNDRNRFVSFYLDKFKQARVSEWVCLCLKWVMHNCFLLSLLYHFRSLTHTHLPVTLTIGFVRYIVMNFSTLILHHKSIPFQLDYTFRSLQYPFVLAVIEFRALVICAYFRTHGIWKYEKTKTKQRRNESEWKGKELQKHSLLA